ncbi:hypothetical protein HDZ31DRAFT_61353 [Schizophyllum fasciatum]
MPDPWCTLVCHRLRATALDMSDLWCTVVLPAGTLHDRFYEAAECYSQRAGGRGECVPYSLIDTPNLTELVMAIDNSASHEYRGLSFHLPFVFTMLDRMPSTAPLQSLTPRRHAPLARLLAGERRRGVHLVVDRDRDAYTGK